MALQPDKTDPNFKEQMDRYKRDPSSWNKPGISANVSPPVRPAGYEARGAVKQPEGREHSVERVRRRLLAHYDLVPTGLGVAPKSAPVAEMLFAIAGQDESKVNYDTDAARNMLISAGLLS